ncbi:MAG: GRAM domain-containing protein [Atribacterota bacterium]
MALALKPGEQVLADVAANLFRGIEAVGGRMKITNQRIVFEPHALNVQRAVLEISLDEVMEVKKRTTLGIFPNGLLVRTKSGEDYKFVVWKRDRLIQLIDKNKRREIPHHSETSLQD